MVGASKTASPRHRHISTVMTAVGALDQEGSLS